MKITIKDQFGETHTYEGMSLKLWREGNTIEVSYMKPIDNGKDQRKVIVAIASNPALVEIHNEIVRDKPRQIDPFTQEALGEENPKDDPDALLETYKAIEGKKPRRKRRTKAQMEADRSKAVAQTNDEDSQGGEDDLTTEV